MKLLRRGIFFSVGAAVTTLRAAEVASQPAARTWKHPSEVAQRLGRWRLASAPVAEGWETVIELEREGREFGRAVGSGENVDASHLVTQRKPNDAFA